MAIGLTNSQHFLGKYKIDYIATHQYVEGGVENINLAEKEIANMKKKTDKGCTGNTVDSILSSPIKKKKHTEEPITSVDSCNRYLEQQPAKKIRPPMEKKL